MCVAADGRCWLARAADVVTPMGLIVLAAVSTLFFKHTSGNEICIEPDRWWLFNGSVSRSIWGDSCLTWSHYHGKYNRTSDYEIWLNETDLVNVTLEEAGSTCHTYINSTEDASCHDGRNPTQCGISNCSDACPMGYRYIDDRCYMLSDTAMNWAEARQFCRDSDRDAALVAIETDEELYTLAEALSAESWFPLAWTGGHFTAGRWRWQNHHPINSTWWHEGELPLYSHSLALDIWAMTIDTERKQQSLPALCETDAWHRLPFNGLTNYDRSMANGVQMETLVGENGCVTIPTIWPSVSFYGQTPVPFHRLVVEFNTTGLSTVATQASECTKPGLVVFTHMAPPRMKSGGCSPLCNAVSCTIDDLVDDGDYNTNRFACDCPDGATCMDLAFNIPGEGVDGGAASYDLCHVKVRYDQPVLGGLSP